MTEPKPRGKVLAGRDADTPFRALNRVTLVVAVAFLFVFAIAFTLWATLRYPRSLPLSPEACGAVGAGR
jgi:hypothetical protein